jgi:hypothetical protein
MSLDIGICGATQNEKQTATPNSSGISTDDAERYINASWRLSNVLKTMSAFDVEILAATAQWMKEQRGENTDKDLLFYKNSRYLTIQWGRGV